MGLQGNRVGVKILTECIPRVFWILPPRPKPPTAPTALVRKNPVFVNKLLRQDTLEERIGKPKQE